MARVLGDLQVLEGGRLGLPYGTDRGLGQHPAGAADVLAHGEDAGAEQVEEGDRLLGEEVVVSL